MSVHVLLNLVNQLRKSDKMRDLSNNTGARMLDSIYHLTSTLLKIAVLP